MTRPYNKRNTSQYFIFPLKPTYTHKRSLSSSFPYHSVPHRQSTVTLICHRRAASYALCIQQPTLWLPFLRIPHAVVNGLSLSLHLGQLGQDVWVVAAILEVGLSHRSATAASWIRMGARGTEREHSSQKPKFKHG